MTPPFVETFRTMGNAEAALWIVVINTAAFAVALAAGHLLIALFRRRVVYSLPKGLTLLEVLLAAAAIVANAFITWLGLILWRAGWIHVRADAGLVTLLDVAVLLLVMDFLMYLTHRLAHYPRFYSWLHRIHHVYEEPRPLTLFVMNPLETLAFGFLWLAVIVVYPPTWLGMGAFLFLNIAFGTIGHLGVEPFPRFWTKAPLLNLVSTSTFHNGHHADKDHNFGFYTLIWDRLFRTLSPSYAADFDAAHDS